MGERVDDRRVSPRRCGRPVSRAAPRPALAARADGRVGSRAGGRLLHASVRAHGGADRGARGRRGHRHRLLSAGRVRRPAESRRRGAARERELADSDERERQLDRRSDHRRSARRRRRPRRRVLDQRCLVPGLRVASAAASGSEAPGRARRQSRSLPRPEGRLRESHPHEAALDSARRLDDRARSGRIHADRTGVSRQGLVQRGRLRLRAHLRLHRARPRRRQLRRRQLGGAAFGRDGLCREHPRAGDRRCGSRRGAERLGLAPVLRPRRRR